MKRERRIIIVAGPNGAGKTTFAREFLPREADCPIFINADLIAAGLSPFRPEAAAVRAGRLLVAEIAAKVAQEQRQCCSNGENLNEIERPTEGP